MTRKETVKLIRETIRSVVPTAEVILYGSEARGEAREDSDINILILMDSDKISYEKEEEIRRALIKITKETRILIDCLVKTRNEWENPPLVTPFEINIMNEGIRI